MPPNNVPFPTNSIGCYLELRGRIYGLMSLLNFSMAKLGMIAEFSPTLRWKPAMGYAGN